MRIRQRPIVCLLCQKKGGQRHFSHKCTSTTRFGAPQCPSRDLPAKALEDFAANLLILTAADDEFFEAIVRQVKGNAGETLTTTLQQRDVVLEEIRCSGKRGEETGEIPCKLRGDGTVMKKWEESKKDEESGNPHHGGSTPRVAWLRERLENSNYTLLRIPIEIHLFERGLQAIYMDPSRLPELLGLSDQDIERLCQAGLVHLGVRSTLGE